MMRYILILVAYLLGSVPFGIFFARLFGGTDPRATGSRNIGATNVRRAAGSAAAALTLAMDILKGAVPGMVALKLGFPSAFVATIGLAAFLGHLYPLFLGFKGGKGVATACGVLFVISPLATILAIALFILTVVMTRFVSLGSMLGASAMPVFIYLLVDTKDYAMLGLIIAFFIIFKHRGNIKRLLAGKENRI